MKLNKTKEGEQTWWITLEIGNSNDSFFSFKFHVLYILSMKLII